MFAEGVAPLVNPLLLLSFPLLPFIRNRCTLPMDYSNQNALSRDQANILDVMLQASNFIFSL
jgi:hypothetical protein